MGEDKKALVIETISGMTVLELAELVKEMESRFGVSAAAPAVAVAAGPAAAAAVVEEKSEFDVILEGFGDKKIQVIKVLRELTGLGLKEAKDLVDSSPSKIKESVDKTEAENMKKMLEEAGATVKLQ